MRNVPIEKRTRHGPHSLSLSPSHLGRITFDAPCVPSPAVSPLASFLELTQAQNHTNTQSSQSSLHHLLSLLSYSPSTPGKMTSTSKHQHCSPESTPVAAPPSLMVLS